MVILERPATKSIAADLNHQLIRKSVTSKIAHAYARERPAVGMAMLKSQSPPTYQFTDLNTTKTIPLAHNPEMTALSRQGSFVPRLKDMFVMQKARPTELKTI